MKVAIAGGSSATLGLSLVSALVATNGRHTPVILSRKKDNSSSSPTFASWKLPSPSSPLSSSSVDVETRYVDYESHESLVNALHDIDTVISVLLIHDPNLFVKAQVNLLHAAEAAGCRRFAPSEFALPYSHHAKIEGDALVKIPVWEEVKKSKIDAALFPCGMFMNYFGIGSPKKNGNRTEALAGFKEGASIFHLAEDEGFIEVPVPQGDTYVEGKHMPTLTFTNIRDVGCFIAAAIDLEEPWGKRELGMAGTVIRLDEIIPLCEKYTGRKMEIRPLTIKMIEDQLSRVPQSLDDFIEHINNQYKKLAFEEGCVFEPVLNRLCPGVQPMSIEEFLKKYWGEPLGISA